MTVLKIEQLNAYIILRWFSLPKFKRIPAGNVCHMINVKARSKIYLMRALREEKMAEHCVSYAGLTQSQLWGEHKCDADTKQQVITITNKAGKKGVLSPATLKTFEHDIATNQLKEAYFYIHDGEVVRAYEKNVMGKFDSIGNLSKRELYLNTLNPSAPKIQVDWISAHQVKQILP